MVKSSRRKSSKKSSKKISKMSSKLSSMRTSGKLKAGGEVKPDLNISLTNSPHAFYDLAIKGKIKYLARLKRGIFAVLAVGDKFDISCREPQGTPRDDSKTVRVEVTELKDFKDFRSMHESLKDKIMPSGLSTEEVISYFNEFYKDKDLVQFGIVAIGFKILK